MADRLHYGTPRKIVHWRVVALLMIELPIGWFMPDVHGRPPGSPMTLHIILRHEHPGADGSSNFSPRATYDAAKNTLQSAQ